jgi:two-component system cell cycle response regulator DivK
MNQERILVIEDNRDNLELVRFLLERAGYAVLEAVNGTAGWDLAQCELPDLILLDMSIPEIDGWELAGRLKADPVTHFIPVIAITGHTLPGDRQRTLDAGCDGYISKPLDVVDFSAKIKAYLSKADAA